MTARVTLHHDSLTIEDGSKIESHPHVKILIDNAYLPSVTCPGTATIGNLVTAGWPPAAGSITETTTTRVFDGPWIVTSNPTVTLRFSKLGNRAVVLKCDAIGPIDVTGGSSASITNAVPLDAAFLPAESQLFTVGTRHYDGMMNPNADAMLQVAIDTGGVITVGELFVNPITNTVNPTSITQQDQNLRVSSWTIVYYLT